jgi:ribosomal protein S18 acetylase RimI-like enzyme
VTRIEVVDDVTDELVEALARLLPQLSSSARPPDRDELRLLVGSDAATLLVARDTESRIVGSLTLALFRTPTGIRAWIEDVVVDERSRGAGLGVALTENALAIAQRAGARTVDLTSRPSREAANALYRRVGFTQRETNVYRFHVGER